MCCFCSKLRQVSRVRTNGRDLQHFAMDTTVHFTSVRNANFVMESANRMRLHSDMCDVAVVVGNVRIKAHRIILAAATPSFHQMLKTSPLPVYEYHLEGVSEYAALRVIEFCYTSAISVPEDSLRSIFVAAAKLGCMEVVDLCCDMLTASLDIATCIQTHLLAVSLDCGNLVTTTGAFFIEHIDKLCVSDTFLGLSAQEMSQFVASLLLQDVEEMQLLKCTNAWFDHVMEDRHMLAHQFTDEFPVLANSLKKYQHLDWPSASSNTILTCSHGDSDMLCQKSESNAINRERTTFILAQGVSSRQRNHLNDVQVDVCVSCGHGRDGQCQLTRHVQEHRETINPGQIITELTNQSENSVCVSAQLAGATPLSCQCPVVNDHLDDGYSECCGQVSGGRELKPKNGSHNPDINTHPQVRGRHCCNHLQKCPQRYLSTEAPHFNQKHFDCTTNIKHNLLIRQPPPVDKVQPVSGPLQVRESDLLQPLEKTTNRQYHTSQRMHSNNSPSPRDNDKRQFFPKEQKSFVRHKRSVHSISIAQTSSQRCTSNYSLITSDYIYNGVDSNLNGMDSKMNTVGSRNNHISSISNGIHYNNNVTEPKHNCLDCCCSCMKCPNESPVAGEFTLNTNCHNKDMISNGSVSVQQQGNIRAPTSRKHTGAFNQQEKIVGQPLGNDLSNTKRQTETFTGKQSHLCKCTICHRVFNERAQLIKHRQDVHGFVNGRLQEGSLSISMENVVVTDGQKQKVHNVGEIVEHHAHYCNLENGVAGNSCRSTITPSPTCEPSRAGTDYSQSHASTQGDHGTNTAQTGMGSTRSLFFPRQTYYQCELCTGQVMTSAYSENCLLQCEGSTTVRRQTASNNVNNRNRSLNMCKGSTIVPCGLPTVHHGPLDLSASCMDKTQPATDQSDREGTFSNNLIAESMAQVLSVDNNLAFVYDLSPRHSVPLSGCIAAALRLPSDSLLNEVGENERETTCIDPPASVNGILTSCTVEGDNSLSVKKTATSHHSLPSGSRKGVFACHAAWLTHTQRNCQSAPTYQCAICQQNCTSTRELKVHQCPNGINKPYTCPHCNHTFAKTIHLKRHLATHSGLKPYPCWICGKRFSRSDHLKRHTQSLHAGSKPHGCQLCGKEFVRKYELSKHMTSHSVYMNA